MHTLMGHDLIDEYRIWIHPVVLGTGKRLFPDGGERKGLRLLGTTTFATGVTILTYQPANA